MATLAQLKAYGRHQARDATGSKADYDITGAINDALGMIARERPWAWYQTLGTVSLQAPYSTGTIAFVDGSANVTMTTGVWPSWAASGKILHGGKWIRLSSRTSDTVCVMQSAWAEASATAQTYVLYRDEYTLPTDCGRFSRLFPGTGWVWGGEPVGLEDVLQAYNAYSGGRKYSSMWALYKDKIILWPYPSASTIVNMMYFRLPATLAADADIADWDEMQTELLYRAIDHQLSIRVGNVVAGDPGTTRAMYSDALTRAVRNDKTPQIRGPLLGSAPSYPANITWAT